MENSTERLQRLMSTIRENSPTGMETVNNAFVRGCGFAFENIQGCMGAYDSDKGMVLLNPNHSDADLMSTMVHECRHAVQPPKNVVLANNLRTNLQWSRAKEADAMAHECAAAFEMKDAVPEVWNSFERKHKGIAQAYSDAVQKNPEKPAALNEAFKAWHDDMPYVSIYDKNVLDLMSTYASRAGRVLMTKDIPSEEIADMVCQKGGKSYVEKGFMTSARALSVDEKSVYPQVMRLKSLAYGYTDVRDNSVEQLYTKNGANEPVSCKPVAEKQTDMQSQILAYRQCMGR